MELNIRKPAVAGMFYPSGAKSLGAALQSYFQNVPIGETIGALKAIIVPHAGYVYSGQVAACGFAALERWNAARSGDRPAKIILLGPSHRTFIREVVEDGHAFWETPMGRVKTWANGFSPKEWVHREEHCLEVEVPFLQHILGDFEILPLVAGQVDAPAAAKEIIPLLDDDTLLVVSSDLSHYYEYRNATRLDRATISAIEDLDVDAFQRVGEACGRFPILIAMHIALELGWKCRLLHYANSGDVTGDKSSVVGYAALEFRAL